MGDKLASLLIAFPLVLAGILVQLAGIAIISLAFPEVASTVWSWLTSLDPLQIITGLIGWILYSMGKGWNQGVAEGVREEW